MAELKPLRGRDATAIVEKQLIPPFLAERERLTRIDEWYRFDHEDPYRPRRASAESKELAKRAQTPWGGLVVTSVAQACYLDGYRSENESDNAKPWQWWQANGMDRRQIGVHRAALAYGYCYGKALPGEDDFGERIPVMRGVSPRRMMALYEEPENDDWPRFAMQADPTRLEDGAMGWNLRLYDEVAEYRFTSGADGGSLAFIDHRVHNIGRCPIVRFTNQLDLEGRADGEIEPFIPLFGRIDQTVFDRLVVQRFASWIVRTASGLSPPDDIPESEQPAYMQNLKLRLGVDDILVADDPDSKFGHLPATPLDGFIEAAKADIMALAAVSQTPAHELLGQLANLSAEALAAARASLTAKVEERQISFGESWEQMLRLSAWIMGDEAGARDTSAQVRWRDTEVRSLAQAADALGKLATMLGVPVEMLWEKIPGWTDQDVSRARDIVASGDAISKLAELLDRQAA